ncbi:MAG: hypothetical protein DRP82_06255 [Planctomycetota bacterium]|nr:MAG: hypothetical protein DRP82_06255 [Planctomycetota bacterium]
MPQKKWRGHVIVLLSVFLSLFISPPYASSVKVEGLPPGEKLTNAPLRYLARLGNKLHICSLQIERMTEEIARRLPNLIFRLRPLSKHDTLLQWLFSFNLRRESEGAFCRVLRTCRKIEKELSDPNDKMVLATARFYWGDVEGLIDVLKYYHKFPQIRVQWELFVREVLDKVVPQQVSCTASGKQLPAKCAEVAVWLEKNRRECQIIRGGPLGIVCVYRKARE